MRSDITQIPAPRVPFLNEETGLISREWFRYLDNIFTMLGSGTGVIPSSSLPPSIPAGFSFSSAGADGENSFIPGPMGATGDTGATGARGPAGYTIRGEDGQDGEEGVVMLLSGAAGTYTEPAITTATARLYMFYNQGGF